MSLAAIYEYGWILTPPILYLLYNRYYLDTNQLYILLCCAIMTGGCLWGGWLLQLIQLFGVGIHSIIVLQLCVVEFEEAHRYGGSERLLGRGRHWIEKIKLEEMGVVLLGVAAWVFLRLYASHAYSFGIEEVLFDGTVFEGFLSTLHGWNCTYAQLTVLPILWVGIYGLCWYVTKEAINISHDHTYKLYLISYLIIPSIVILTISILYSWTAFMGSEGILDCYWFWKNGWIIHLIQSWGTPLTTIIFFIKKHGHIELKSNTENSEGSQPDK